MKSGEIIEGKFLTGLRWWTQKIPEKGDKIYYYTSDSTLYEKGRFLGLSVDKKSSQIKLFWDKIANNLFYNNLQKTTFLITFILFIVATKNINYDSFSEYVFNIIIFTYAFLRLIIFVLIF